jgi:hypothetical protein
MNKVILIISLIFMIFLCSVTKAASQEHPNSSPFGRIRKISGSSEEGLLEACARIAQERGFYPSYVADLPEIQLHLDALRVKCADNKELEKAILNFIFNGFKSDASQLSPNLLKQVQHLNAKNLTDLQKEFLDISKS